jgi:trk system potassium uptake protein TrkH
LLMMIGASPAGTGGGIKPNTFWHLFTGMADILRGRPAPRAVAVAAVWIAGYLVIAFLAMVALSTADAIPPDRLFFTTVSALSNVGMSHDPISTGPTGLYLLDAIMLIGRLSPMAIIWWMAHATPDADVLVA